MTSPIVIYQMGKVGSSALFTMLTRDPDPERRVFHVHSLRDDRIGRNIIQNADWQEKRHIVDSIQVRRLLNGLSATKTLSPEQRWKFITPVREPIARNISAFFQNHRNFIPEMIERWRRGELTVNTVRDVFLHRYDHTIPFRWFGEEYQALFGLDVFSLPFDRMSGYTVLNTRVFDILLLRSEEIDTLPVALFERFTGLSGLKLARVLEGKTRDYAEVFQVFKREVRFTKQFVDSMLDTPFVKHFYTAEQMGHFREGYLE